MAPPDRDYHPLAVRDRSGENEDSTALGYHDSVGRDEWSILPSFGGLRRERDPPPQGRAGTDRAVPDRVYEIGHEADGIAFSAAISGTAWTPRRYT